MTTPATQLKASPETHLQRTLNSALNELAMDSALAAVFHQEKGPLVGHASRGFTPRDVQAILRTLSTQPVSALSQSGQDQDAGRTIRLRLITPAAKTLLGIPLRHRNRSYGYVVIGRKDGATFAKKDKILMDQASEEITKALEREGLFDTNVVLSRSYVSQDPVAAQAAAPELFTAPSPFTPELQHSIETVLAEANQYVAFDRAWACHYDPLAGNVEVLGMTGDLKGEQKDSKKDLKPGLRLTLDSSASGWAVRHRKPTGGPRSCLHPRPLSRP